MIAKQLQLNLSPYADLYDILIPKDNFLRKMHDAVDFSFVYDELKGKYCLDNGRTAYDPILMFKLVMLKTISGLSDRDLMDEVRMNMAYKYFLDLAPEAIPPCHNTLCEFRRQRLKDSNLLDMLLDKTWELAEDRGMVKRDPESGKVKTTLIIDATHTQAIGVSHNPVLGLKERAKRLRGSLYAADESLSGKIEKDHELGSTDLEGEMAYCQRLLAWVQEHVPQMLSLEKVGRAFRALGELLADIADHCECGAGDPEARTGHKTADSSFYGYKSHLIMDSGTRLLVGTYVTTGEVNDSEPGQYLLSQTAAKPFLQVDALLGDAAYAGQKMLKLGKQLKCEIYAPPKSHLGHGIDGRDDFTYNKDADMFTCPKGHMAIKKRNTYYKKDNRHAVIYTFDKEKCHVCPLRDTCLKGEKSKEHRGRTFSVTALSKEQRELLESSMTEEFKEKRRERYKIEQKNAHLKIPLHLAKSMYKGLAMMTVQSTVTCFVANLFVIFCSKTKK